MAHKPRWKNGGIPKGWLLIIASVMIVAGYFWDKPKVSFNYGFNPKEVVENSPLKGRNFKADVKEISLPESGLKAYYLYEASNPIVSLSFLFLGAGSAADDENMSGAANFAASMLGEGTESIKSRELKEKMADLGIHINFSAGQDDISGTLVAPKANFEKAAEILRDILAAPRFDKEDVERIRSQLLAALKKQSENPSVVLALAKREMLYPGHPYARNPLGTEKTLQKMTTDELNNLIKKRLAKSNLIIGIAGDVSETEAENIISGVFNGLAPKAELPFVREAKPDFNGVRRHLKRPLKQTVASFSGKGASRQDKDFYPLYIANYIFGGAGLNSRLSQAVREKEGLVYSIYSYLSLDGKSPMVNIGFSSTGKNYSKVLELLSQESEKMQKGVSPEELVDAKDYLISSYNLRFADIDGISQMLVYMQKDNLGLDFLQKRNSYVAEVKIDDVNAAAVKYFNLKRMSGIDIGE